DINYDGIMIHVESATVTITDNSAVAQTRGVPNGYTRGSVSADVEVEVDAQNFKKFGAVARSAGSWRAIPEKDFLFYANNGSEEEKIEVFGCVPMLSDVVNISAGEAGKTTKKIKFMVTSPDFISIDGVPYLSARDTRDLKG
ncbi:TPA: phage protein, partial [Escherichia coli]